MQSQESSEEKKFLEEKVREIRQKMVRQIEKKCFFDLPSKIRQIQKHYQLLERI